MSSNMKREHFLDWRAPLRGAAISSSTVAWVSHPTGLVFSNLRVQGTKTVVDITPPGLNREKKYNIHCKMTDSAGLVHETEPPIQMTVQAGGNF